MLRSLMVAALSLAKRCASACPGDQLPVDQCHGLSDQPDGGIAHQMLNMWTPNVLQPPPIRAGERRQVTFNARAARALHFRARKEVRRALSDAAS